jgi:hypothetical protein
MPLAEGDPGGPVHLDPASPHGPRTGTGTLGAAVIAFLVCLVVGTGATVLRRFPVEGDRVVQPIAFNHRKHVQDEGLECIACHAYYETETFSGLPGPEACALCHHEPKGESAEEKKLVGMLQRGEPLLWKPLFQQPAHVFYSHRRHVVVAGIECTVCHGNIADSERPPERVVRLTMKDCLRCHTEKVVSTDCTACHR